MKPKVLHVIPQNKFIEIRFIEVQPDVVVRGVFARRDIKKGTLIAECPVIPVFPGEDWEKIDAIKRYAFTWETFDTNEKPMTTVAICLGVGSIFNHSDRPNAEWETHLLQFINEFYAKKKIRKGEEIFMDYDWDEEHAEENMRMLNKFLRPVSDKEIKKLKKRGEWNESDDTERTMYWDEFIEHRKKLKKKQRKLYAR